MNKNKKTANNHFYIHSLAFWIAVFVRISTAFFVFKNPLLGIGLIMLFDHLDSYVLMHYLGMRRKDYYSVDKILDWFIYTVVLFSSINDWFFSILLILFIYRAIGYAIVIFTKKSWFYLIFPNVFEFFYLWFNLCLLINLETGNPAFWLGLLFLVILKELQETWIYYIWPEYLKKHGYPKILSIFGQKKEVNW